MQSKTITHEGVVEGIKNNKVLVRFTRNSACSDCHAKGICSVSDQENKALEFNDPSGSFRKGEKVQIILTQSSGFRALSLGYLLPFLIVLLSLILLTILSFPEGISGLLSLSLLVPYFLLLKLLRRKLDKSFTFSLRQFP